MVYENNKTPKNTFWNLPSNVIDMDKLLKEF
jgi:hypothetical protein